MLIYICQIDLIFQLSHRVVPTHHKACGDTTASSLADFLYTLKSTCYDLSDTA